MQTTIRRKQAATPEALTEELLDAQAKFVATRNSVIERATQRQQAIAEIQRDLAEEQTSLQEVVTAAEKV